jgi:two-component system, OmpR family, response regulator
MKLLLIEDDVATAAYIHRGMKELHHVVDVARSGHDGLALVENYTYDVLIVDRMLPGLDGLSLVKRLRQQNVQTPIIFLTTMSGIDDRVEGLNAGGDDYLVKPFAFSELYARVIALTRRPPIVPHATHLKIEDLEMDVLKRRVTRGGTEIDLQPREFMLLEFLVRHAGQVVTRSMLLENVWDYHFDPKTSIVETHISRIRAKVDRGRETELIQTIRGVGYCIRATASAA